MQPQEKNNFLLKFAVHYNKLLHNKEFPYLPATDLDDFVEKTYFVFIDSLPIESKNLTITEIGSGAGKWTAILSQHFSKVLSIEPDIELIQYQQKLLKSLHVNNVEVIQDGMPDCVDSIITDGVFFAESIYLAPNWKSIVSKIAANSNIKFIGIIDCPDDVPFTFTHHRGLFSTPIDVKNKLPILENDEFVMKDMLQAAKFQCQVFDVETQSKTTKSSKYWYLTGQRK